MNMEFTPNDKLEEKKKIQNFIEETINKWEGKNGGEFHELWTNLERSVSGRVAYKILKEYEEDPLGTIEKYNLHKSTQRTGGIAVDLNEISKDIWIPKKLKEENTDWGEFLDIFNQDEINNFVDIKDRESEEYKIMMSVLSCKDEKREILGEKFNLFLNDPNWREKAKDYAILLVSSINKSAEERLSKIDKNKKDEIDGLKSVKLMTEMYLKEIK